MAPDRAEIAFVSGGDIWRVPANGGEASLLVSHPADESRPMYSPDGKQLAFQSTRSGAGDIYVLDFASGTLRRLTFEDGVEQLDGWSRDGAWIYFHGSSQEVSAVNDVFKVRAGGGTPIAVAADRYTNEFFAAPAPDGKTVAINARGIANSQWWRKGHSNIDRSEIWLVRGGAKPSYTRVTDGAAKEIWPMWHPDGKSFFFVSDRTGVENVWRQPLGGTSRQVSQFKDGRVLWPAISHDGKTILFERDFAIWKMDSGNGKAQPVPITLRGAPSTPSAQTLTLTNGFSSLALSPDGKKLAFAARGEIFAASAKDGGDAQRVTRTFAQESNPVWSPDSLKLAYTSDRGGVHRLFLYDFAAQNETQLTSSGQSDNVPRFSPDGKSIAFFRGGKAVWVYDLESRQERQVAAAEVPLHPLVSAGTLAWSPDGRWIAFASRGAKEFTNINVVEAKGGAPAQPVSFLANHNTDAVAWSPAGRYLLFNTGQRTEEPRVARVDLTAPTPEFREDRFRELFEAARKRDTPAAFDFEAIRKRLTLLPVPVAASELVVSGDGKTLLLTGRSAGQENLYTWPLEELRGESASVRQLTSTARPKADPQFTPDGKEVYFLEDGSPRIVNVESRAVRPLSVRAGMEVDFDQEKREVFQQAWSYERDHFFDDKYNGVDWGAAKRTYEPLVAGARTAPELYRILNLMMGELNASHMGISPRRAAPGTNGHLGVRLDPGALEAGQFTVAEVIPLSPAAIAGVKAGESIFSIGGVKLTPKTNVQELLEGKAGRRVEIAVGANEKEARVLALRPVPLTAEKELLYRAWVDDRRSYVEKTSGGRLGYVHMRNMSAEALAQLHIDLDTENHSREGVVIDLRNNSGGFVNAYALDVFSRRPYLTFQERGRPAAPARPVLGQRALELPTVLVTNQHSLSDAEDFTEGYRRLRLGKVVGEPTAGWIVYTWNEALVDGSQLRLPRIKVFDAEGQMMEMHPRPVDVPVERQVGESYGARDSQLDAAIRELLQELPNRGQTNTNQ